MKQLLKKAKYISIFALVFSYLGCEKVENVFPKVTSGFTFTATDKGNVTFINTSEEAQTYLWDFGDGDSSTEINPVKSYAASGTFKVTLKASNNAGASDTSEAQLTIEIAPPADTCTEETVQSLDAADFNLTFQTDPGDSVGSFDAVLTTIANPDFENTVNPSCQVGQIDRNGDALFANNQIEFDAKFDFNANAGFKLKVWSPVAGTNVLVKLEDKADAGINTEVGVVTTTASAWEELTFDFESSENGKYDKIILFFELNTNTTETYYIDDFTLYGDGGGATCTPETSQSLGGADLNITFQTDPGSAIVGDGAAYSYIDNPDPSGINTSCKIGEIVRDPALPFANNQIEVDSKFDFTANSGFKLKVWAPAVGTNVLLKLEDKSDSNVNTEVGAVTTTANAWEELTFDFPGSETGKYDKIVLFLDINTNSGETYYLDDFALYGDGSGGGGCTDTALELPIDFDCSTITYDFATFNGASYSVLDNPDLSGVNNVASKVGEIVNIGGAYEGGAFTLDTPVDFATDKAITMKFYSTVGVDILLKFEGAGAPVETTATHGGTGWEQLTFTFTTSDQFTTLVLFVDGPGTTAGTFYMDDIEQVPAGGGGGTGGNLAANGDFETGDDTGWLLFQNGGTSALDNTINNGGSWSGKLATGGPSNPAFKQERIGAGSVNAGDTVQVQFDHIGSVVQPGAVFNVILFGEGAAGASFTNVFNPAPSLTGSWTTFTGTFAIPGGTDVSEGISFLIEAVCGGDAGCSVSANIDNVSVTVL